MKQNTLSESLLRGGGGRSPNIFWGDTAVLPLTSSSEETKTSGEMKGETQETKTRTRSSSKEFSGAPESDQANKITETFFHAPALEKDDIKTPCKDGFRIILVCLTVLPMLMVFFAAVAGKLLLNYDVSLVGMCKSLFFPLSPRSFSCFLLALPPFFAFYQPVCMRSSFINWPVLFELVLLFIYLFYRHIVCFSTSFHVDLYDHADLLWVGIR